MCACVWGWTSTRAEINSCVCIRVHRSTCACMVLCMCTSCCICAALASFGANTRELLRVQSGLKLLQMAKEPYTIAPQTIRELVHTLATNAAWSFCSGPRGHKQLHPPLQVTAHCQLLSPVTKSTKNSASLYPTSISLRSAQAPCANSAPFFVGPKYTTASQGNERCCGTRHTKMWHAAVAQGIEQWEARRGCHEQGHELEALGRGVCEQGRWSREA